MPAVIAEIFNSIPKLVILIEIPRSKSRAWNTSSNCRS